MALRPGNTLEEWEIAIVKAMLAKKYVPQDIQAYFSRPMRSINHAHIPRYATRSNTRMSMPQLKSNLITSWRRGPMSIPRLVCIIRVMNC